MSKKFSIKAVAKINIIQRMNEDAVLKIIVYIIVVPIKIDNIYSSF